MKPFLCDLKEILMTKNELEQVKKLANHTNISKSIGMLIFFEKYYKMTHPEYSYFNLLFSEGKRVLISIFARAKKLRDKKKEIMKSHFKDITSREFKEMDRIYRNFLNNSTYF